MVIISMLAALVIGVAARAGETARNRQTEHTVLRLHRLLMAHHDTYKTRRVKVRPQVIAGIAATNGLSRKARLEAPSLARLYALRELMIMEMPDRWSDVLLKPVPNSPTGAADALYPYFQDSTAAQSTLGRSGLATSYLRRYDAIARGTNSLTGSRNTRDEILSNQSAECLYLIITLATGDGEARSQFGEDSIGDTDGDGAHEFLDSWGRPISFLRAAPGFDSQVQINANELGPAPANNQKWEIAAAGDHDPFDLYRVDPPAFRLVPLIFSFGGDETAGIDTNDGYVVYQGIPQNQVNAVPKANQWPPILPWAAVPSPPPSGAFLGTKDVINEGSGDNIHNHLLGRR
jgi:hypothetical protein